MQTNWILTDQQSSRLFYFTLICHVALWGISPLLIRHTLSNDVIEAFVWGQHLDWGYDKNPYLVGWLTRAALSVFSSREIGYYLIQQIFIGIGFWSIWQLGQILFDSKRALVAVLIYEGCLYFSVYAQTNNDNFPLVGLWGIAAFTFYLACHQQRIQYWCITGLALGLAMMVKYSTLILMVSLLSYLLIDPQARRSFRHKGLYVATLLFLVLTLPNLFWLFDYDFIAIKYFTVRKNAVSTDFIHHLIQFIEQTTLNFLPCILLFLLTIPKKIASANRPKSTDRYYVWCIGILPITTILCLAILGHWKLYWEWGAPFVIFWGLPLVQYWSPRAIKAFIIGVFATMILSISAHIWISCYQKAGKGSADYPAQEIANYVSTLWHSHYQKPLLFVGGSRYTAGYASFYSPDKPKVFVDWNTFFSPGVTKEDIEKYGAIFIQDGNYGTPVMDLPPGYHNPDAFPDILLKQYPRLTHIHIKSFPYYRSDTTKEKANVLIGILPPICP